jgi:hypothetical protein
MTQSLDLNKVLNRVDLVHLVEKAGATLTGPNSRGEYRGTCVLHDGSNPTAFLIYRDNNNRQRWRCWACDQGGDAISFVMATENLDFIDAVKRLGETANLNMEEIGLSPEAAQEYEEHKQRTDILDLAARYFAEQLWSEAGKDTLDYARSRGFTDDVLRMAGWGFANGDTGVKDYLENAGADMVIALKTGIIRKDGRDFTVNADGEKAAPTGWLIYPHRPYPGIALKVCSECQEKTWHSGSLCLRHDDRFPVIQGVTYFSSRALEPINPKDKSRNLPGSRQLYKAEVPGVRDVILCEGPADAESYRQMGFTAWALCGLGYIPEDDLIQLRQRPVVYLALDGDKEGNKAQAKIAPELGPLAMLVEPIEGYKDANEYLQQDGHAQTIRDALETSTPTIDDRIQRTKSATPHALQHLTGEIIALLHDLPKELEPRYLQKTQRALGMSRKELRALMEGTDQDDGDVPILSDVKRGQITFLGEPLANFAPSIGREVTIIDGLNLPTVRYTIGGRLNSGEILPEVEVDASEFVELKWIGKYWGARPILYVPRGKHYLFVRAIQETSLETMTREQVFTHTGWAEVDKSRSFLTINGRITADGFDDTVQVDLDDNLRHYALPAPPKKDSKELVESVKASLNFLKLGPLTVTAPIWAGIFAGPLTSVRPLYTVLWLYGSTRSGKSTIAHLALTHFGSGFIDGRQYHAPVDWMSTAAHIEETMFAAKDIPLIIDDFAPQFHSANDSRKMHKAAHDIVRAVGNRSARGRSKKYQKQTLIPRGIVFSTAELPLTGESTVGRMIYVSISRGDVLPRPGDPPREALNQAQKHAEGGLYAQAMAAYIQWLAVNWERASGMYLQIIEESSKYAQKEGLLQDRLIDYYGLLNAAQQVALTAFQEIGVLSALDAQEIAEGNRQAIQEVLVAQAERIAAESPVRKFFEALSNLMERKKVYLAPRTKRDMLSFIPPQDADLVGYFDPGLDGLVYLNDLSCLSPVKAFWGALGENFDTTRDAMRRQFMQIGGLIARSDKGESTTSVWTGSEDKTQRLLVIDPERVINLFGVVLKNGNQSFEHEDEQKELENDEI